MRFLALAFYLVLLGGCSEDSAVIQHSVLQLHKDDNVNVRLSPAEAPVEQVLHWTVELSAGWHIKQAEVVGVSMHMGTIPLVFKARAGDSQTLMAEMVLGACSQPRMKWQLQLLLQHATLGEQVLMLPFYASWPS